MKLFLSLFLSVCISLSPLYSSAEIPDLMPVYKTDQMTVDQVAVDSQTLLEEMKMALNNPSARKEISKNLDKPDFQKGLFAGLEKQGMAKEDIAELQQSLNDPVLREEAFSQIANLDMEKAEVLLNDESFQEETLSQNSELIAQLNHNIDQMIESDHAPGSMAMLGASSPVSLEDLYIMFDIATSVGSAFAVAGAIVGVGVGLWAGSFLAWAATVGIYALVAGIIGFFGILALFSAIFVFFAVVYLLSKL